MKSQFSVFLLQFKEVITLWLCFCSFYNLTVMDVFTVKNFFIKELNQYVRHFNKTELKTENVNNSL